jgi:hypothetical protein
MRWIVSLVLALGLFSAGVAIGAAQVVNAQPVPLRVMSGDDVGFRVQGRKGDTPVGTLVVRVNGEWVEVQFAVGVKRITE